MLGQLEMSVHDGTYGLPSCPGGRCSVVCAACGEARKSELICRPGNASGECSFGPSTGRKNTGPASMPPAFNADATSPSGPNGTLLGRLCTRLTAKP